MKKNFPAIFVVLVLSLATFFFSYRLTQDPPGLTVDEASIGYNAVLIERTLRDETGRFLPIFPLTINGHDWKQPSSVYAGALIFKLFGASLFNLRMVSVLTAIVSLALIIYLNFLLLGLRGALISSLLFLTAPIVLIHSHLAQENIMPIPFITTWLIGALLFQKKRSLRFLLLAGFSLGLGIYSYKGMRAIVPPLALITCVYLLSFPKKLKHLLVFCFSLSPFILTIPWVNAHYAGALFDNQGFTLLKYYDFLYPYLSSFDISALFIKGDITPWHSTGLHGVFLISTLPLYVIGLISAYRQKIYHHFWLFLLCGFFLAPLLFGQVGSIYRFSRLLTLVPFFVTFCTLGVITLINTKRGTLTISVLVLIIGLNFLDFARYYWFTYPVVNRTAYGQNTETYYQRLADLSEEKKLEPYIFSDDYNAQGEDAHFFEAAYFENKINQWKPGDVLPTNAILMTRLANQPGLIEIENYGPFFYFVRE